MRMICKKLVAILLLTFFCKGAWAAMIDRMLATVNNEVITLSDYKRYVSKFQDIKGSDIDVVDSQLLRDLIEEKIILQEAKKNNVDVTDAEIEKAIMDFQQKNGLNDEDFRKKLDEEGVAFEEYKRLLKDNIISTKFIDKEIGSKIIVSESEIKEHYEQNKSLFLKNPDRMLVKGIFIRLSEKPTMTELTDLKIKTLRISEEIKKGESFDKLVNMYAEESLKNREGVLGDFEKGSLIPVLDKRLSSMKEGEISEPVWTKEGVYILNLVKKTDAVYASLDEVRDQIYNVLYEKAKEKKYKEWVEHLWSRSAVSIK